jgi:hypothetical protein
MGLFSRIGRGIRNVASGINRAASNVVRTVAAPISNIVSQVPIVGGLASSIIRTVAGGPSRTNIVPPPPPVPATPPTPPNPDGTPGNGAELWKFSKTADRWSKVIGTPKKIRVDGVDYDWVSKSGISYYALPLPEVESSVGNTSGVGVQSSRPLTKEDTQISFEQLISGLHFYYEESNFRSNSNKYNGVNNYAFLAYLAARELFGNETPIIEGRGTTKKLRQWEAKIKLVAPRITEDAIIRVLNIIGEDILAGGNGYLNTQTRVNGLRGGFFGSNRNAKNFREDIETKTGPINNGNILINYDDLLINLSRMDARDEFIMTRMTSMRNVLRKAWEKRPGSSKRSNRLLKDRTIPEWKNAIDKEIRGNGIKKNQSSGAFAFNSTFNNRFGNLGSTNAVYDETWMDLMILLNASARAKRKTGSMMVTKQNGKQ